MVLTRSEIILRCLDNYCDDHALKTRTQALYFLLHKEFPDDTILSYEVDKINSRKSNSMAFSMHCLSNYRKKLVNLIVNGCDFDTACIFYFDSLKKKNGYNPDGWKKFEKVGKKGLRIIYDFIQKRKISSFADFEKIVWKKPSENVRFFSDNLEEAVKIGEKEDLDAAGKDKKA